MSSPADEASSTVVTGWKADVWKLQFHELPDTAADHSSDSVYGDSTETTLEKVVSFQGPNDDPDEDLSAVLGSSELKTLLAADVTLSGDEDDNELILCCLTENGFVTTHVRPFVFSSFARCNSFL